ncbi:MAG TPA: hypothetical protein VGB50_11750 [Flavobacterium sp.]|jgi:hypothetical protein
MKKKVNVLLILVVTTLWGFVGYRYLNRYFQPVDVVNNTLPEQSVGQVQDFQKDTFEMKPIPRDPFLNASVAPVIKEHRSIKARQVLVQKIVRPKAAFPQINYFGYLKSGDKSKELVILKVNNNMIKMRLGEVVDGLRAVKISKDSIRLAFNGEQRSFRKN